MLMPPPAPVASMRPAKLTPKLVTDPDVPVASPTRLTAWAEVLAERSVMPL